MGDQFNRVGKKGVGFLPHGLWGGGGGKKRGGLPCHSFHT